MAVKLIAPYKQHPVGTILTPERDLEQWLLSRKYAVATDEQEPPAPSAPAKGVKRAIQQR